MNLQEHKDAIASDTKKGSFGHGMSMEQKVEELKAQHEVLNAKAEVESIMQFFKFDHLPPNLQPTSKAFHDLAATLVQYLPRNPERTVALRKLLEAKDCAVRAAIYK